MVCDDLKHRELHIAKEIKAVEKSLYKSQTESVLYIEKI